MEKGKKYGRLKAIRFKEKRKSGDKMRSYWLFKCDCGNSKVAEISHVKCGHTQSCGCLQKEKSGEATTTHGMTKTTTYSIWINMKDRCCREKSTYYKDYGGRGIKVCDRWLKFENFLADMGKRPEKLLLERIDNNGNYEYSNCKWATKKQQANNKRNNVIVNYKGDNMTLSQLADLVGVKYKTLRKRIVDLKWPIEKAVINKDFSLETRFK